MFRIGFFYCFFYILQCAVLATIARNTFRTTGFNLFYLLAIIARRQKLNPPVDGL